MGSGLGNSSREAKEALALIAVGMREYMCIMTHACHTMYFQMIWQMNTCMN